MVFVCLAGAVLLGEDKQAQLSRSPQITTIIQFADLQRTLTLGTTRHPPAAELLAWIERHDLVDPESSDPEKVLAAFAVAERLQRFVPRSGATNFPPAPEGHPGRAPSPRLTQALGLVIAGPYDQLLPEAVSRLREREMAVPARYLPALLDHAVSLLATDPATALGYREAGGARAGWLAGHHPDWEALAPAFPFAPAWAKEATPGGRAALLRHWRLRDPDAAREALGAIWAGQSPTNQETLLAALATGLSARDVPWLRRALAPQRKGVRRQLARLLLVAGEEEAREDFLRIAVASLDANGRFRGTLGDARAKNLLRAYGGTPQGDSLASYLLSVLPPSLLADLLGKSLAEFWADCGKAELAAAATAVLAHDQPYPQEAYFRFVLRRPPALVPMLPSAKIVAGLEAPVFEAALRQMLEEEGKVFAGGGVPRLLALARPLPWSERITKAYVGQLLPPLRAAQQLPHSAQQELATHWRAAIPLLHVGTLPWLRTQIGSLTERPDAIGKLAAETLQVVNLRRALRDA